MKKIIKTFILIVMMSCIVVSVNAIPEKGEGYVNDYVNILSNETEQAINEKAALIEEHTNAKIYVVTVDSTEDKEIEDYAYEVFNTWQMTKKNNNNSLLFLIVPSQNEYYIKRQKVGREIIDDIKIDNIVTQNKLNESLVSKSQYDKSVLGVFEDICNEYEIYYEIDYDSIVIDEPIEVLLLGLVAGIVTYVTYRYIMWVEMITHKFNIPKGTNKRSKKQKDLKSNHDVEIAEEIFEFNDQSEISEELQLKYNQEKITKELMEQKEVTSFYQCLKYFDELLFAILDLCALLLMCAIIFFLCLFSFLLVCLAVINFIFILFP